MDHRPPPPPHMWTLGALPDVLRINFSEPPLKRASELLQIQHLVPVGFPCLRVHKLLRCLIIHEFDCFREDLRVSSDSYASHGFVDGLRNPDRFLPPALRQPEETPGKPNNFDPGSLLRVPPAHFTRKTKGSPRLQKSGLSLNVVVHPVVSVNLQPIAQTTPPGWGRYGTKRNRPHPPPDKPL